jgi:hypothetical protein
MKTNFERDHLMTLFTKQDSIMFLIASDYFFNFAIVSYAKTFSYRGTILDFRSMQNTYIW